MLEEKRLAAISRVGKLQESGEDAEKTSGKSSEYGSKTKFAQKIEDSDKEIKEGELGKIEFTAE